jgi:hypothetical protein
MKVTRYKFSYGDWYETPNHPIESKGWLTPQAAQNYIDRLKSEGWNGFSEITEYHEELSAELDVTRVNRVEVIDKGGRICVKYCDDIQWSLQDDNQTLKIFVK